MSLLSILDELKQKNKKDNLIDSDDVLDVERVSGMIKNQIERGEKLETIARYRHKVLKEVLSFYQVVNRSQMTTKIDMAKGLFKHFGVPHKKKKKKKKK